MAENNPKTPVKEQKAQESEQNPTLLAIDALESCQEDLKSLLSDKHDVILIGINAKFELMKNQLRMLSGTQVHLNKKLEFKPVTNFMGDDITKKTAKEVKTEDLSPRELEIKNLTDKANQLQEGFDKLDNKSIVESYQNDYAPIRLLAKRAGLDDYKEAKITEAYIDLIRNGFAEQQKIKAAKEKDANALKNKQ